MAGPTLSQRLEELKGDLKEMAEELATYKAVAEFGKKVSDDKLSEVDTLAKKLQEKIADAAVKLAAIEERIKSLEKGTDRIWQFAPMVISGVGVVIAIIALFVKK